MSLIAIDVDVVLDKHWGAGVAKLVYKAGWRIIWIGRDNADEIRNFERNAGIPPGLFFTNETVLDGLATYQTHFSCGEVDRLISDKDESLMLLFEMVLPCSNFVRLSGPEDFDFLKPPSAPPASLLWDF